MTYITVMLITLTTGDQYALGFDSARICGEALLRVEAAADEIGVEVESATCYETVAPATSWRPKRRPEAI